MLISLLFLISGLVLILIAAEFFTNGIEEFGRYFSFSQAVVGSIFAAVGTALPETILPAVAIFMYGGASAKEIGVGAILGAPFMLSTLAFFLVGLTVTIAAVSKKRAFELKVEAHSIRRDLIFFLLMYSTAIILPIIGGKTMLVPISVALIIGYLLYAYLTFRSESAEMEHSEGIYLWRVIQRLKPLLVRPKPPLFVILAQIALALAVMIKGAHTFVQSLELISARFGMDPLIFSLLLAPVATELPEKFNSVTWTWKGRDTLALGNITGAMVFQSTFPVSVGLIYTDWNITGMALFSAVLTIISASAVLGVIAVTKRISPFVMLLGGVLYLVYAGVLIFR
ncbi:MAG: sodium:calcium antiporter [Nitrospirae bacterium]|nr:sodium:calcium antiporter [Nitrospirota bacterium]